MVDDHVSIPYQSGQSFRRGSPEGVVKCAQPPFQSPTNRGSLSDPGRHRDQCRRHVSFNPLPIGAVFPTQRQQHLLPPLKLRFNPLPIGAVFPTGVQAASGLRHCRAGFNPLPIGAVFPTTDKDQPPTTGVVFQSPTNRGSLSDNLGASLTDLLARLVSIPYQSGQSFRLRNLGNVVVAIPCFNPLPIGAVFPTQ